MSWATR